MSKVAPQLQVLPDLAAVAEAALQIVSQCARQSVQQRGRFTIALSGGSTPRALYQRLAQHPELPWQHIQLCFGDERAVPPTHPDSNARMVQETLGHCPFIPPENVHRIPAELPPAQAASAYQQTLHRLFGATGIEQGVPRFDMVLLGLGPDGHTASLFPHTVALSENSQWVVSHWVEAQHSERITLTFPVLNHARQVLFLVVGAEKASALRSVLEGDADVADIPARGVRPTAGQLGFLVDRAASAQLSP